MMQAVHTDTSRTTHWHILGAGAMGCMWADALHSAGFGVSLILRDQPTLARYPGRLSVEPFNKDDTRYCPVPAWTPETGPPNGEPVQWLLVATKAQNARQALASVQPWLGPGVRIVLLQNGLKVQQELSNELGADHVFCLTTSHGAWLRGPWHVVQAGLGEAWLGQLGAATAQSQVRVHDVLSRLPAEATRLHADPDIQYRLWQKFAINCAINALTVIYNCRNGELLERPERLHDLQQLCEEITQIITALPEAPETSRLFSSTLYEQACNVLQATASNLSSTLQDAQRRRPTELAHLNGYLITLATCRGLTVTLNTDVMERASRALPLC